MSERQLEKVEAIPQWGMLPKYREGNIGKYPNKLRFFENLLAEFKPKVSAQTGLNAGHSALVLLTYSDTKLYSFDIAIHDTVRPVAKLLKEWYGDRHEYTEGDSMKTLPNFDVPLDFVFVDGGHSYELCNADIRNFDRILKVGGVMVIDDIINHTGVGRAVREFGWKGYEQLDASKYGKYENGVTVFKKIK